MPAGGAQPSAPSLRVPSLAARSQAHTPTGITAAIIPAIPITPTATIRRTATAQPITAMPLRPGPTAAAGAGAMVPLSRVLNGSRPPGRIGSLTRRSALAGAPAFFSLQSFVAAVPGLTKFRQINRHDRERL